MGSEAIQVYDDSGSTIGLAKNTSQEIVFGAVPDAGATITLLGFSLPGLFGVNRRFAV